MHIRAAAALVILPVFIYAGCAAFRVPDEPPTPTALTPVWSDDELEDHLEYLNESDGAERTTGTSGYARAAAYVAARMREFRLQPVEGDDYRVIYTTPMNYPLSAALRIVRNADSTLFYPGIDFLVHGRSDSGYASVRTFVVTEDTTGLSSAPSGPFGVVFRRGDVEGAILRAWRGAGAVLAIAVQPLTPRFHADRIPGLLAVQITRRISDGLLVPNWSNIPAGSTIDLPWRIVALARTDFQQSAGAINLFGFVAGKHPVSARELVLICADLDGTSNFAGTQTVDFENFGVGTAALLEVARNLGSVSRRWSLPERSVLLAVWSGSKLGHQGLRHFLSNPYWERDRITAVIYVGLDDEEVVPVQRLLETHGLALHVIRSPATPLFERPFVLQPDLNLRRLARDSREMESSTAIADPYALPDMDDIVSIAVGQAKDLAAPAYERLLLESTDIMPYIPANEDSLVVPQAAVGE